MGIDESLVVMKALADSSRLKIIDSLIHKPQYVEELAQRLGLAVSTVSFHLKKLEAAKLVCKTKEQYYVFFHINREIFDRTLRELTSFENSQKTIQDERILLYRRKVISAFFEGGRLLRIPVQYKKRQIVLEEILKRFEAGREYHEKEIDAVIEEIHDDYCSIRRYFIDEAMMYRNKGIYRLNSEYISIGVISDASSGAEASTDVIDESEDIITPAVADARTEADALRESSKRKKTGIELNKKNIEKILSNEERKMDSAKREELKKSYKLNPPPMGVYQIKNLITGNLFIGSNPNLNGIMNRHRFTLNMGKHPIEELQESWNETKENNLVFEIIDRLEPKEDPEYNYKEDLELLEEMWYEKLRLQHKEKLFRLSNIQIREEKEIKVRN